MDVWDLVKLVAGALLGYWLGQRGADRQFRRQQVRQRVDEARKAYVECLRAGRRLTGELYLPRNKLPADLLAQDVQDRVAELQERLADAEIALGAYGATSTVGQFQEVRRMASDQLALVGFLVSAVNQGSHTEEHTHASYSAGWFGIARHMEQAEQQWEQWQADQEAVAGRWTWLRQVRGWPVWAQVQHWSAWQRFRRRRPDKPGLPPDSGVS